MQPETSDDTVRCPECSTTRLKVLPKLDRIDRLHGSSLANRMRARRGDTIYHCVFCRLQFYDPQKPRSAPKPETNGQTATPAPVPETAKVEAPIPTVAPVVPAPAPVLPTTPSIGTLFGARTMVRGSIQSTEDLRIEGRIEGTLACRDHRITIGSNANVKATVRAGHLEVLGTLRGNSQIQSKTILHAGASVVGDIRTADIVIEDGAHFKGSVELIRKQPELPLG